MGNEEDSSFRCYFFVSFSLYFSYPNGIDGLMGPRQIPLRYKSLTSEVFLPPAPIIKHHETDWCLMCHISFVFVLLEKCRPAGPSCVRGALLHSWAGWTSVKTFVYHSPPPTPTPPPAPPVDSYLCYFCKVRPQICFFSADTHSNNKKMLRDEFLRLTVFIL